MLNQLHTADDAPWKQRFRTPLTLGTQIAGKTICVHWFETGHLGSFAQTDLAIQHQEFMLRFAYSVLG